jgi:hypothetical protein
MSPEDEATTIIDALQLARERVTGDDLAVKQEKRDRLKTTISRVYAFLDGDFAAQPSASELRELLGDPDDKELRASLDRWDSLAGNAPE